MENLPSFSSNRRWLTWSHFGLAVLFGSIFVFALLAFTPKTPPAATVLTPANNLPGTPLFNIKGEIQEFKIVGGAVDEAYNQDSTNVVAVYGVRKGEEDEGHNRFIILDFTPINPDGVTTVWAKQATISGPGPTSSIWLRINRRL